MESITAPHDDSVRNPLNYVPVTFINCRWKALAHLLWLNHSVQFMEPRDSDMLREVDGLRNKGGMKLKLFRMAPLMTAGDRRAWH